MRILLIDEIEKQEMGSTCSISGGGKRELNSEFQEGNPEENGANWDTYSFGGWIMLEHLAKICRRHRM